MKYTRVFSLRCHWSNTWRISPWKYKEKLYILKSSTAYDTLCNHCHLFQRVSPLKYYCIYWNQGLQELVADNAVQRDNWHNWFWVAFWMTEWKRSQEHCIEAVTSYQVSSYQGKPQQGFFNKWHLWMYQASCAFRGATSELGSYKYNRGDILHSKEAPLIAGAYDPDSDWDRAMGVMTMPFPNVGRNRINWELWTWGSWSLICFIMLSRKYTLRIPTMNTFNQLTFCFINK